MQNTPPVENAPGSNTPLYAREFPGFELDFKLPVGFKDTSWHNNETPSFDKVQPDGTILKLWWITLTAASRLCQRMNRTSVSRSLATPRTRIGSASSRLPARRKMLWKSSRRMTAFRRPR